MDRDVENGSKKVIHKKYRPITQSFYGVHHHKKFQVGDLVKDGDSIRERTKQLNEMALNPSEDNLPLIHYATQPIAASSSSDTLQDKRLSNLEEPLLKSSSRRMSRYSAMLTNINNMQKIEDELPVEIERKVEYSLMEVFQFIPAVFLGVCLNVLNAVSYGMVIFPSNIPVFADFGPIGISMLMISTATSQTLCSWGSIFEGGAGGFMLEIIPFLHIICQTIVEDIGPGRDHVVIATTMIAFALSSFLTGLCFLFFGYLKLGSYIGFFPRHILVGCIGGVGYFLMQTAVEVATDMKLSLDAEIFKLFFSASKLPLWILSIVIALCLKLLQRRIDTPILMPAYYLFVPILFFIITNILGISMDTLKEHGWLFKLPEMKEPFYYYFTKFDLKQTSWSTLPKLGSTMAALIFFGVLHVPINVPALGVTFKMDQVNINQELMSHGYANLLSSCFGSLQNYILYSSTVLFVKSGGTKRIAGVMLSVATYAAWFMGPGIVAYIPTVVVGSLIFHLGLELFKEGIYETYGAMSSLEYVTVWMIIISMALFGFVEGVFIGIILACIFFVFLYSNRAPIRASYGGIAAKSTVRRLNKQRQFLDKVSSQIHVLKLQGFMFFGTIDKVETLIRALLEDRYFLQNPIRFLVLDLSLVSGVDFSAAEAFIRIKRILCKKQIHLVISGLFPESDVALALLSVGIWHPDLSDPFVHTFESLNDSLEWCENTLLESFYHRKLNRHSKRTDCVNEAATLLDGDPFSSYSQPMSLLATIFEADPEILFRVSSYFTAKSVEKDELLWNQGDESSCFYLVEDGTLKASVKTSSNITKNVESIMAGSCVGELTFFTNKPRMSNLTASSKAKLWELNKQALARLKDEAPKLLVDFMQVSLSYSAMDMNVYSIHAFDLI